MSWETLPWFVSVREVSPFVSELALVPLLRRGRRTPVEGENQNDRSSSEHDEQGHETTQGKGSHPIPSSDKAFDTLYREEKKKVRKVGVVNQNRKVAFETNSLSPTTNCQRHM